MLNRCNVYPNAYYNFLKNRKAKYHSEKKHILAQIEEIYHSHNGIDGYRKMKIYLARRKIKLSPLTVHKYMNTELQLRSVVRRKNPGFRHCTANKIFPDLLRRNFTAERKNTKWATDFTYLYLSDGSLHYNCSIIDLYDRSVVASLTDSKMTASLAIRTLKDALRRQPKKISRIDFTFGSGRAIYFSRIHFFLQLCRRDSEYEPRRLSLRQFSHGTLFQHLKDRTHLSL